MTAVSEIKDFTEERAEPKRFKIDGDIFELTPVLPAGAAVFLGEMAQADQVKQLTMLGTFLDMVVLPGSADRFAERIKSPTEPISSAQLGNVLRWLLEEYGTFPTQQSSISSSGSLPAPTGMSSTAGVQPAA